MAEPKFKLHTVTTTVLAAAGLYRSTFQRVRYEPQPAAATGKPLAFEGKVLNGVVSADVNSAAAGFFAEFSADGVVVAYTTNGMLYTAANGELTFSFPIHAPFVRLSFTNGAVAQATFLLGAWISDGEVGAHIEDPSRKVSIASPTVPQRIAEVDAVGNLQVDVAGGPGVDAGDFQILAVALPDAATDVVVTFAQNVNSVIIRSRNGFGITVRRAAAAVPFFTIPAAQSLSADIARHNSTMFLRSANAGGDTAEVFGVFTV